MVVPRAGQWIIIITAPFEIVANLNQILGQPKDINANTEANVTVNFN